MAGSNRPLDSFLADAPLDGLLIDRPSLAVHGPLIRKVRSGEDEGGLLRSEPDCRAMDSARLWLPQSFPDHAMKELVHVFSRFLGSAIKPPFQKRQQVPGECVGAGIQFTLIQHGQTYLP